LLSIAERAPNSASLGGYCPIHGRVFAGMSVEDVPAIVNIKTLMGRLIAHEFNTGWTVGLVKSEKEEECCWPVCSQVWAETY